MKTLLYTVFTLFISLGVSAQCISESNDKYTIEGNLVKVERFDDSGNLMEIGTYSKDGALEGKWMSYRTDGSLKSVAFYSEGEKVGNWTHYDEFKNQIHQVSYEDGIIASAESTDNNTLVKE